VTTGTWEPDGPALPDAADLAVAAACWRAHGSDEPDLQVLAAALDVPLRDRLRGAMQAPACTLADALAELSAEDAADLARLLTVLEAVPGFEAGARSPVVPLMKGLRPQLDREAYAELVRWIRAHTENRFLPHGSLQDRLRA
jgi:hypothetical protein